MMMLIESAPRLLNLWIRTTVSSELTNYICNPLLIEPHGLPYTPCRQLVAGFFHGDRNDDRSRRELVTRYTVNDSGSVCFVGNCTT